MFKASIYSPHRIGQKEETVVFPDERKELKMSVHDPCLTAFTKNQDEAHRFANRFNADLRSKKIKESILDDFIGLGKIKRQALMEKFGTLEKLKKSDLKQLTEVEGIGRSSHRDCTNF